MRAALLSCWRIDVGYRNILLHLDEHDDEARLGSFLSLAHDLGARELTAVAAAGVTPPLTGLPIGPGQLLMREADIRAAMLRLRERISGADFGFRVEWRSDVVADPTAFMLAQVARSDLVMVRRRGDTDRGLGPLDLERLVFGAGRPTFVVSETWDYKRLRCVLVAYKAGREARLAVTAALPLLQLADQVLVVGVGDESTMDDLADVAAHLGCHGVYAEARHVPHKGLASAGALIDAAQAAGCGAIVCGAFRHGRVTERLFGGVTRDLLIRSPLPCLMVH